MSEEVGYWEKTWNLPLADKAETIDGTTGYGQSQRYGLMREIYNLIDKNPDKAYEIAKHAMQTKGLLFYPDNGSEMHSYPVIICKAASCDKKVVNLILEHMEEKGFDHENMFSKCYGWGEFDIPAIYNLLQEQLNEGNIEPARMFEALRRGSRYAHDAQYEQCLKSDYKPESSTRCGTVGESLAGKDENRLHRAMADCVIKDPKLWDKYYAHVNATMKMNVFVGEIADLIKCCNAIVSSNNTNLPRSFCNGVVDIASKVNWDYRERLKPVLEHIAIEDLSYFYKNPDLYSSEFSQQVALKDHSIIPSLKGISRENFDAFAKIYEDEYKKASYGIDENNLKQKNVVLEKENNEIMDTIKTKILEKDYYSDDISKPVQVWLVKNAQKYPNLVSDCLKTAELPYVEMCIKNIENPEKENIASLLNRLEAKENNAYRDFYENRPKDSEEKFDSKKYQKSLTFADFQDAQDFVARRDMCMRATGGEKQLSYDMAELGVSDFKTAKRIEGLFWALNDRPETYGSSYNQYYPAQLLPIAKSNVMQDWMYPVMMDAIEKGGLTISEGRMPSERTLFDCCKAWKINPAMPQRLAKFVGTHSLRGRMLAGAIFDKMVEEGKTTLEEWRDNKILHEKFYEELARAEKMPREKAFQQYIPNTPVNRKRVVGMGMEEKGIENTPENFKSLYRQMREQGIFEKMLAKPEEARTTFSSRLLVETARRKFDKSR